MNHLWLCQLPRIMICPCSANPLKTLAKNHFETTKLEYEQKERDRLRIAEAAKLEYEQKKSDRLLESMKMINSFRDSVNAAISELNCEKRSINVEKCKRTEEIGVEESKNNPLVEGLIMNMNMIDKEIAQKSEQLAKLNAKGYSAKK